VKFGVESEVDGPVTILAVSGEVDIQTSPGLRSGIEKALAPDRHLIIDLTQVHFMDSTGLGVLVGGLNRARQVGASLALVCTLTRVLKLFEMTGLRDTFAIYGTRGEALEAAKT
jgi:anti-sigma B factor antagonist